MVGLLDFAYTPHLGQMRAFGRAWCGPTTFEHGKRTLVAAYPPEADGQGVHVFCTALPATFYELVVSPGVNSGGEASPGYVVDNLIRGMGQRVLRNKKHEDAYLTRIVEAVQAAFRELETPAKRREQLVRLEHANALIKAISDHGRRFFWNENDVRLARLELDPRGRVWFHDDYQGKRIYTHDTGGRWRGFSHGGTMRNLVILMRDYVTKGRLIPRGYICTRQLGKPEENVWGYDNAAADDTRAAAFALPIMGPEPLPKPVLP